jgi:hypothetical protein
MLLFLLKVKRTALEPYLALPYLVSLHFSIALALLEGILHSLLYLLAGRVLLSTSM